MDGGALYWGGTSAPCISLLNSTTATNTRLVLSTDRLNLKLIEVRLDNLNLTIDRGIRDS
jgi:hypothetical protein